MAAVQVVRGAILAGSDRCDGRRSRTWLIERRAHTGRSFTVTVHILLLGLAFSRRCQQLLGVDPSVEDLQEFEERNDVRGFRASLDDLNLFHHCPCSQGLQEIVQL